MEGTRSRWRISVALSLLILLVLCIALIFLLGPKCAAAVEAQPSNLVPLPFLVFVAYEMVVLLHHLARIVVAHLFGMKLLTFACGPFAIRRIRDRMRFFWNNRETMISGTTVFGPTKLEGLGWRCVWLVAVGPLATILVGLLFLMGVGLIDSYRASIDTLFFSAIAFLGITVGMVMLLPLSIRRSSSYALLLWDGMRGSPTCEILFLVTALINEAQQGVRPRDWSSKMLQRGLDLSEKYEIAERATICLLAYYRAVDLDEMEQAARYMQEAFEKRSLKIGPVYSWIALEKAFFEARFRQDEAGARAAFEQVGDWSKVPHHAWLRVSAAMALLEGKPDECRRQAREALEIMRSLPVVHQFVVDWLEELVNSSRLRC